MRILYVATVGITMRFFEKFVLDLVKEGHTVDVACNNSVLNVPEYCKKAGLKVHTVQTSRSPLSMGNLTAVKQINRLVKENGYDIVHCHTPVAAMCTRIACRKLRKSGVRVIYTAHGFHFFKGAPIKNWLLFYPIEKICSYWTDVLITINREDYALAKKHMKAKSIEYVPGVGIDLEKFKSVNTCRADKRREIGVPEDALLFFSVGELNHNKNHETVIRAISDMDVYYAIAGEGERSARLIEVANSLGFGSRLKLLGFRGDIAELCKAADAFVFPSFREGLPVSVMEAMASGLPVACSRIRGNSDLIDENGGALFDPHDVEACRNAVRSLLDSDLCKMGKRNEMYVKKFEIDKVNDAVKALYDL